jgi:hypothetical protein
MRLTYQRGSSAGRIREFTAPETETNKRVAVCSECCRRRNAGLWDRGPVVPPLSDWCSATSSAATSGAHRGSTLIAMGIDAVDLRSPSAGGQPRPGPACSPTPAPRWRRRYQPIMGRSRRCGCGRPSRLQRLGGYSSGDRSTTPCTCRCACCRPADVIAPSSNPVDVRHRSLRAEIAIRAHGLCCRLVSPGPAASCPSRTSRPLRPSAITRTFPSWRPFWLPFFWVCDWPPRRRTSLRDLFPSACERGWPSACGKSGEGLGFFIGLGWAWGSSSPPSWSSGRRRSAGVGLQGPGHRGRAVPPHRCSRPCQDAKTH